MIDLTYEGWVNRETWCANLWLSNDEGTYRLVNDLAADALTAARVERDIDDLGMFSSGVTDVRKRAVRLLAEQIEELFGEAAEQLMWSGVEDVELRKAVLDIGSLYRVEWRDIAAGFVSDVLNAEGVGS